MSHLALFIEPTSAQLNIFSAFTLPRLGSFILAGLGVFVLFAVLAVINIFRAGGL